uniref:Uncharacterized protein n=1 Tax=Leviviridae sp. TaxID=2027243 RepID=A0A514D8N5_9VIRU|nr:MAG: hypothetical protein H1RhizoL1215e3415_000002 [Leviviridae sp.]
MNKILSGLAKALKVSQEAISALESQGIDVNRLIGISNAQGPIAKLVHGFMTGAIQLDNPAITSALETVDMPVKRLPSKTTSSSKKKKRAPTNTHI